MKHLYQTCMTLTCAAVLAISCKKEEPFRENSAQEPILTTKASKTEKTNTFFGPQVHIGDGKMRSFFTINKSGEPLELGVELTAEALQGLPSHHAGEHHNYPVVLHKKATEITPFKHLEVNWNPAGHAPSGVYTVPHFDFHFYEISQQQQLAIPPYSDETAHLFDHFPPSGYLPSDYVPTPGGEPQMGKHWVDVTSPEMNGQPFTKTFIFGTYDGAVIFYEPMVTKAFIENTISSTTLIKQPTYFSPANTYYPTEYKVYKDSRTGNYYISLSNFRLR